MELRDIFDL